MSILLARFRCINENFVLFTLYFSIWILFIFLDDANKMTICQSGFKRSNKIKLYQKRSLLLLLNKTKCFQY